MVDARTAVLLALRRGPAFGRELLRRVRGAAGGRVRLAEGSVYPALRSLERARLAHGWIVVPGRRRGGRARRYYELTERGIRVAEAAARDLRALAGDRPEALAASAADLERMRERLVRAAELSEEVMSLRLRAPRRKGAA